MFVCLICAMSYMMFVTENYIFQIKKLTVLHKLNQV